MVARDGIEPPTPAFSGLGPREVGVTSESQNNPVSANGVNSAMTQSVGAGRRARWTVHADVDGVSTAPESGELESWSGDGETPSPSGAAGIR